MVSNLFVGEREHKTVDLDLKAAVDEFNSAVMHFGQGLGFKVFDLLRGISFYHKFGL